MVSRRMGASTRFERCELNGASGTVSGMASSVRYSRFEPLSSQLQVVQQFQSEQRQFLHGEQNVRAVHPQQSPERDWL